MSMVDFLARPCSGLPLVPCCLVLVGLAGGLLCWLFHVVSPVVGMVKFLRRHSPVCFLVGVVALASAEAAALRLCPVYLGVAHFTKVESAQTELAVFLGRLLLLSWHLL